MLDTTQNAAVVAWLERNSIMPKKAALIWALILDAMDRDGYVHVERQDLADAAGIHPREVSRIRTELIGIHALLKERRRGYPPRFRINPRVGTHLTGQERDQAKASAPELNLQVVDLAEERRVRRAGRVA